MLREAVSVSIPLAVLMQVSPQLSGQLSMAGSECGMAKRGE